MAGGDDRARGARRGPLIPPEHHDTSSGGRTRDLAVPLLIWAAAMAVARAVGFRMHIPWEYWQLLDAPLLSAHPLASLCYLHSQPPGLNTLAAVVLAVARWLGTSPEPVAAALFAAAGALGSMVTYQLARRLTGSTTLAAVAVVAVVADPAYHTFGNLFFYEFLLHLFLVLLVTTAVAYLDRGSLAQLYGMTAVLAAISLTRTLYHPAWSIGFWVLVVVLRGMLAPQPRARLAAAFAVLLAALAAWPAKNALVYGQFRYSTMSAFSLARGIDACGNDQLEQFAAASTPLAPGDVVVHAMRVCGAGGAETLTAPMESNGTGNWNGFRHVLRAPAREACAIAWIRNDPGEWLGRAAGQYAMWMRPAFLDSYFGMLLAPDSVGWARYAAVWRLALFGDLRPLAERWWPSAPLHRYAMISSDRPVGYSLYGFVLFPLLVAALALRGVRRWRTPDGAIAWVLLAVIVCPMVAACLTDGVEGNRMRFATTPLVVVALLFVVRPRSSV